MIDSMKLKSCNIIRIQLTFVSLQNYQLAIYRGDSFEQDMIVPEVMPKHLQCFAVKETLLELVKRQDSWYCPSSCHLC